MSLLEVEHLRKSFGELVAVDNVSFHVDAGEIFGLLGPNGAGKSTTMHMIAGLLSPEEGRIRLEGRELGPGHRTARRILGVVPQDLAIYPDLTAWENLDFFGRLYGLRSDGLRRQIESALERTGLAERAHDRAGNFSGGMKRRLNFGIALLHAPKLLILDEPTVGVDPQSRAHLLDSVRELSSEGIGCIYASHYMEEVQSICQRVAIMDHGRVVALDMLPSLLGRLDSELLFKVSQPPPEVLSQLREVTEVRTAPGESDGEVTIVIPQRSQNGGESLNETLVRVNRLLRPAGVQVKAIETREPNLERLFLELTGSRLRD
jgi:ABC-2 type transport system ATP-binding protein